MILPVLYTWSAANFEIQMGGSGYMTIFEMGEIFCVVYIGMQLVYIVKHSTASKGKYCHSAKICSRYYQNLITGGLFSREWV